MFYLEVTVVLRKLQGNYGALLLLAEFTIEFWDSGDSHPYGLF
jgi:hypothetical protein